MASSKKSSADDSGRRSLFFFRPPEWVKDIKDKDVRLAVYTLLFIWTTEKSVHIDKNLRDYVRDQFEELTDKQVDEVVEILVEWGVVKLDEPSDV